MGDAGQEDEKKTPFPATTANREEVSNAGRPALSLGEENDQLSFQFRDSTEMESARIEAARCGSAAGVGGVALKLPGTYTGFSDATERPGAGRLLTPPTMPALMSFSARRNSTVRLARPTPW